MYTIALGIGGLLAMIAGIVVRNRRERDLFYIGGGILLTLYSLTLGDAIFVALQVIFTLVALYDYQASRHAKRGGR